MWGLASKAPARLAAGRLFRRDLVIVQVELQVIERMRGGLRGLDVLGRYLEVLHRHEVGRQGRALSGLEALSERAGTRNFSNPKKSITEMAHAGPAC